MDDQNRDGLIKQVTLQLITAYGYVIKALQGLPLPIEIPPLLGDQYRAEVSESLIRVAEVLLTGIPMDPDHRQDVRALVIDWLAANDYLFALQEDYATWKLDFVVTQLTRVKARWQIIQEHRSQE
ncbi:hypothetical protein ACFQ07_28570 [Actinomadura adrarensis]|uniref:Uncharacterized protein n=1 Tax=Actinomadura adrarensis TaxID=1819600 RepID=A0ABW3CQM3_9ACTN